LHIYYSAEKNTVGANKVENYTQPFSDHSPAP